MILGKLRDGVALANKLLLSKTNWPSSVCAAEHDCSLLGAANNVDGWSAVMTVSWCRLNVETGG